MKSSVVARNRTHALQKKIGCFKHTAGDSLTDVQWSLYLQDLGCCCTGCSVVTNCKMLVVR